MTAAENQRSGAEQARHDAPAGHDAAGETATPPQGCSDGEAPPDTPNQPPPASADQPVHLYDAVATQRDHVLNAYGAQRAAVLEAVAEQRQAATAPIRAVRERQAMQAAASAGLRPAELQKAGGPLGANPLAAHKPYGATAHGRQQLVATDIVATLKAMIAEEVRAQLRALLDTAEQRSANAANAANGKTVPERHN